MSSYNRSIKMFDEPHPPVVIDRMVNEKSINKGKFLTKSHSESYLYQMQTISKLQDVNSVLEIGPGEGFVAKNLRQLGYEYHTLDFEDANEPTIKADFSSLEPNQVTQSYDLTCACQVLEHFPYESFLKNLTTLAQLSKKYVLISLPYSCKGFSIKLNISQGQHKRKTKQIDFYLPTNLPNRKYRKEYMEEFPWAVHYWEIGRKGFPLKKILQDIESCKLKILDKFHSPNPFHYFILSQKE